MAFLFSYGHGNFTRNGTYVCSAPFAGANQNGNGDLLRCILHYGGLGAASLWGAGFDFCGRAGGQSFFVSPILFWGMGYGDLGQWGILLLNILPTIPFDGGCIVFLFLARRSCLGAARLMGLWGQAAGGILAVLGIVQMILCPPNALLFLTGGVVFFEGRRLYGRAAVKLILAKRRSKGRTAKVYFYYLPDHASSWDQLRLLGTDTYVVFLRQKKGEIRWETEQEFLRRLFAEAG